MIRAGLRFAPSTPSFTPARGSFSAPGGVTTGMPRKTRLDSLGHRVGICLARAAVRAVGPEIAPGVHRAGAAVIALAVTRPLAGVGAQLLPTGAGPQPVATGLSCAAVSAVASEIANRVLGPRTTVVARTIEGKPAGVGADLAADRRTTRITRPAVGTVRTELAIGVHRAGTTVIALAIAGPLACVLADLIPNRAGAAVAPSANLS